MTKNKRFKYHHQDISFDRLIHIIYDSETQQAYSEENLKDVVDLLNNVTDENMKLKQALLFYIDVVMAEFSSDYDNDIDNTCKKIFGCSYAEIEHINEGIETDLDVFKLFEGD